MAVSGVAGWPPVYGRLTRPRQRIAELGLARVWGLSFKAYRWFQASGLWWGRLDGVRWRRRNRLALSSLRTPQTSAC